MDSLEKIRCFKLLSELKTAALFEENVTREIVHLNLSGEITWQVPKVELIFLIQLILMCVKRSKCYNIKKNIVVIVCLMIWLKLDFQMKNVMKILNSMLHNAEIKNETFYIFYLLHAFVIICRSFLMKNYAWFGH